MSEVRRTPCPQCPYRRDVPSGVWAPEEYEKLRGYEGTTAEQSPAAFSCHATPERLCHGWACTAAKLGDEDHAQDSLALRLIGFTAGPVDVPPPAVPLWDSHEEAAAHGEREIEDPGPDAVEAMNTLRRYPRLKEMNG